MATVGDQAWSSGDRPWNKSLNSLESDFDESRRNAYSE